MRQKHTVASPNTGPLGSPRMDIKTTAGIIGPPKQAIQYAHAYLRKIVGSVLKKKTRKTLKAMAKDHHGSDCINLTSLVSSDMRQHSSVSPPFKDKCLRLTESRFVTTKQTIVAHHGRYACSGICKRSKQEKQIGRGSKSLKGCKRGYCQDDGHHGEARPGPLYGNENICLVSR